MISKGRPKSEEKNRQIAEAAAWLFINNGFEGTSMDHIADRAGVSKQTVYSHFRSKEDLFQYAVSSKCVSYELSREFVHSDRPLKHTLMEVARRFNDLLMSEDSVHVHRLLVTSGEEHPALPKLFFEAGPQHMMDFVAEYLKEQVNLGRLAISDFDTAAEQFLCLVKGTAHMCALLNMPQNHDKDELERYLTSCVDMFVRAYTPGNH